MLHNVCKIKKATCTQASFTTKTKGSQKEKSNLFSKTVSNKKVLLRERKRHTARRVKVLFYLAGWGGGAELSRSWLPARGGGGTPVLSCLGGDPQSYPGWGGVPQSCPGQGVPQSCPGWGVPLSWGTTISCDRCTPQKAHSTKNLGKNQGLGYSP